MSWGRGGIYRRHQPISIRLVAARVSFRMALDACAAAPRAPHGWLHVSATCRKTHPRPDGLMHYWSSCKETHHLTHVDQNASVACAATPRAWSIHLVLLHVRLHVLRPCTVTLRDSADTQLVRCLTPRSEPMQRVTSSFSVHSSDFDPSGKFLTRDQSRIFFRSCSDELNIFNKIQSEF